jgi:hypothetical protein
MRPDAAFPDFGGRGKFVCSRALRGSPEGRFEA